MAETTYVTMPESYGLPPTMNPRTLTRKPLGSPQPSDEHMLLPWGGQTYAQSNSSSVETVGDFTPMPMHRAHGQDSFPDDKGRQNHINQRNTVPSGNPWKPGFWVRFPVLGIATLFITIGCTIAAFAVSSMSDKQPIDSWRVSPSVFFSVFSTISNISLAFALADGLVVSFWRKALEGSSLPGLQGNWRAGASILGALLESLRGKNVINSAACVLTAVAVIRGPLLQRSTSIVTGIEIPTNGTTTLHLSQSPPDIYGGISVESRAHAFSVAMQTPNFTEILQSYSQHSAMKMNDATCGESCSTQIKGFGLQANCSSEDVQIVENSRSAYESTYFETTVTLGYNSSSMGYTAGIQIPSWIVINATYLPQNFTGTQTTGGEDSPNPIFTKTLVSKICRLYGGTVAYDIVLQNDTVQLKYDDWREDKFLEEREMLGPSPSEGGYTLIGGLQYASAYLFNSNANYRFGGTVQTWTVTGTLANQFIQNNNPTSGYTWADPTDFMINQLRDISFRISLQAAKDNITAGNASQTVQYTGSRSETIFVSDFGLVAAASVVNILAVLAVLLTFKGWWKLGRDVSMSPLEIAKAFDAPLLRNVESNATCGQIGKQAEGNEVSYGDVGVQRADGNGAARLGFATSRDVNRPAAGSMFCK